MALLVDLTPRQEEVALLLADGLGIRQIAARLGIAPATVEDHRDSAKERLGVRTTTELVVRVDRARREVA